MDSIPKLLVGLFAVIATCVICSFIMSPTPPANTRVSEHSFIQLKPGSSESDVTANLGTPNIRRTGERVKYERRDNATWAFGIDETQPAPYDDILDIFSGLHGESIRVLFKNSDRTMIGAEYALNGIPIFYFGDKSMPCKSRAAMALESAANKCRNADPVFVSRRDTLVEFFGQQIKPVAPATATAPATAAPAVAATAAQPQPAPQPIAPKPAPATFPALAPAPPPVPQKILPVQEQFKPAVVAQPAQQPMNQTNPTTWEKIELPSGKMLLKMATDIPKSWSLALFPEGTIVRVGYYPDQSVSLVVSVKGTAMQGPAATLYPNGALAALGTYDRGKLVGGLRLWDEQKHIVLYGEYQRGGSKDGLLVLFDNGLPQIVQEWVHGDLQNEYLVKFKYGTPTLISSVAVVDDDEKQFHGACDRLEELTNRITKNERELKALVRNEEKRIREENRKLRTGSRKQAIAMQTEQRWRSAFMNACNNAYNTSFGNR